MFIVETHKLRPSWHTDPHLSLVLVPEHEADRVQPLSLSMYTAAVYMTPQSSTSGSMARFGWCARGVGLFALSYDPVNTGGWEPLLSLGKHWKWISWQSDLVLGMSSPMRQCFAQCREPWSWPGLAALRGMCHRFFRLESMTPGAQCAFQLLRDQGTLSGSKAIIALSTSLYVPFKVKEVWKPDRTIGLRH